MNRDNLLKKLVDRKLAAKSKDRIACVPCFGAHVQSDARQGISAPSTKK